MMGNVIEGGVGRIPSREELAELSKQQCSSNQDKNTPTGEVACSAPITIPTSITIEDVNNETDGDVGTTQLRGRPIVELRSKSMQYLPMLNAGDSVDADLNQSTSSDHTGRRQVSLSDLNTKIKAALKAWKSKESLVKKLRSPSLPVAISEVPGSAISLNRSRQRSFPSSLGKENESNSSFEVFKEKFRFMFGKKILEQKLEEPLNKQCTRPSQEEAVTSPDTSVTDDLFVSASSMSSCSEIKSPSSCSNLSQFLSNRVGNESFDDSPFDDAKNRKSSNNSSAVVFHSGEECENDTIQSNPLANISIERIDDPLDSSTTDHHSFESVQECQDDTVVKYRKHLSRAFSCDDSTLKRVVRSLSSEIGDGRRDDEAGDEKVNFCITRGGSNTSDMADNDEGDDKDNKDITLMADDVASDSEGEGDILQKELTNEIEKNECDSIFDGKNTRREKECLDSKEIKSSDVDMPVEDNVTSSLDSCQVSGSNRKYQHGEATNHDEELAEAFFNEQGNDSVIFEQFSSTEREDDEISSKDVVTSNIDPSSAASEQVLEGMMSSASSQPSFDDPTEFSNNKESEKCNVTAGKESDVTDSTFFVYPDVADSKSVQKLLHSLNYEKSSSKKSVDFLDDNGDLVEKLPMSPLTRSGSRIIDKKTKNIRGRTKSFLLPSLSSQSETKEEIFMEMGFGPSGTESPDLTNHANVFAPQKVKIPLKSMKVQSLLEMDEEENDEGLPSEKTRVPSIRGSSLRPKSFPNLDASEFTDLSLDSESVRKIPDILDRSIESGYASSSYMTKEPRSPPPASSSSSLTSLAPTPPLTMSSTLTQPSSSLPTDVQSTTDHFESCKGEKSYGVFGGIEELTNLVKYKAILRRDANGYGLRTCGNKPVSVLSVVEGSVAARHGLKAKDVIFMLNGTNVSQYDNDSVSSFFKASKSHIEIVVLRHIDCKTDYTTNQIEHLKQFPALMSSFLCDLILCNKQNGLFFSMAVYLMRQKDIDCSNFQRWSYEIFSTFLDQHAPLKLQLGLVVPSVSGLLSSDETSIRRSYDSVDDFLQPIIKKQLSDYLKKNGLVHEFELTNMDAAKQMKHVEKTLWKSFETLCAEERDDKKQALASSIATFFHLIGFSSNRSGNLLDNFPSFVSSKMISKIKKSKGHMFKSEFITNMSPCGVCKQPTWTLGLTVLKCSACGFFVHTYCLFKLTEACNFKRKTTSYLLPSYMAEDPNASFDGTKSGLFRSRSCQLATKTSFIGDPDLDVQLDLPSLKDVIPHEEFKKLKSRELKFQETVNEFFHTERLHVRNLKVMKMLYERPMRAESSITNLTNLLFPNIDELIRVHELVNMDFQKCKEQQKVVTKIADVLISQFTGIRGDHLKRASATFCKDQSYALFALRKNQRKEKVVHILQEAALNPYSGRLGLKDFLPKEMQRITKYPLLIDNLIVNSPANSEEHVKLLEASKLSRSILRYVDGQVRDCENGRKLMDLQMRLDGRQLENSTDPNVVPYRKLNLTKKKLVMDGEIVWKYKRAGGSKTQDLHVVLCEDILLLLVKQESRLVLKCHSTTIEDHVYVYYPVLKLNGLLTKDAGRDKCAFFIIDSNAPQVYHLVAKTKELRNRWFNAITEAVSNQDRLQRQLQSVSANQPSPSDPSKQLARGEAGEPAAQTPGEEEEDTSPDLDILSKMALHGRRESAPSLLGSLVKAAPLKKKKSLFIASRSFDVSRSLDEDRFSSSSPSSHQHLASLFSPLSSPQPSSSPSTVDDLKRNILSINDLLLRKVSLSKVYSELRPDLRTSGQSVFYCPLVTDSSIISQSILPHHSADSHWDEENEERMALTNMTEKELVLYCMSQVDTISNLVNDSEQQQLSSDVNNSNNNNHSSATSSPTTTCVDTLFNGFFNSTVRQGVGGVDQNPYCSSVDSMKLLTMSARIELALSQLIANRSEKPSRMPILTEDSLAAL